ncbi:MAG: M24 family metallopeptidase [Minwuia sp.]|uniref:M24 family metallopeptidase n=1 Tax=Minwuia sp. TaxID=2493630 RepID=UPI003A861BF5
MTAADFPVAEFEQRTARAQAAMHDAGFDALFLTTEAEVRYFTGFRTLFWQSPTRPWFLVVPAEGKPVAVVPEIGGALMHSTWLDDVRTWSSPAADDDGIGLLADVLRDCGCVGMPKGRESALRMPLIGYGQLRERLPGVAFGDATPLVRHLRMVKSEAEIGLLRHICGIASDAFDAAPHLFHQGQSLDEAFRAFRIEMLRQGADDIPYLVGGAGPGGYADVISPPDATPLAEGDVLMLDTGATYKGYYCDFDRNWAFGSASDTARRAYETLYRATDAALEIARPGVRANELWAAMQKVIDQPGSDVGQLRPWSGHPADRAAVADPFRRHRAGSRYGDHS